MNTEANTDASSTNESQRRIDRTQYLIAALFGLVIVGLGVYAFVALAV